MGRKKGGSSAKNGRDSNPKYLGVKLFDGEKVKIGGIIVRQRGSRILPGKGVGMGKDYTLFAVNDGAIKFEREGRDRKKVSVI